MSDVREVVVIGGGLAGMSAALACAQRGRRTTLVAGGVPGGQLVSINRIEGVPGFPDGVAGYDLCPMTQEQADKAGVEFSMAVAESGWTMTICTANPSQTSIALAIRFIVSCQRLSAPTPTSAKAACNWCICVPLSCASSRSPSALSRSCRTRRSCAAGRAVTSPASTRRRSGAFSACLLTPRVASSALTAMPGSRPTK